MASEPPVLKTLRVLLGQQEAREKLHVEDLARAVRVVVECETQVSRSALALEAATQLVRVAKCNAQPVGATSAEYLQHAHAFRIRRESERQICLERNARDTKSLEAAEMQATQCRVVLAETKAKREAVAGRIAETLKKMALAAETAADDEASERAGRRSV